jgi:hypothetical protein
MEEVSALPVTEKHSISSSKRDVRKGCFPLQSGTVKRKAIAACDDDDDDDCAGGGKWNASVLISDEARIVCEMWQQHCQHNSELKEYPLTLSPVCSCCLCDVQILSAMFFLPNRQLI